MISLATSSVSGRVRDNVLACLDENRLGGGRFIGEFERMVADYTGAKHAIAVANGTLADIVALGALVAKDDTRSEVIVPALTFIAQTNAVIYNGLTPVFVDVGDDFQMDIKQVEEAITEDTLAIFPVHLLGKACDIEKLREIADKRGVFLVEDCCEAYGGESNGKKLGTFGDFGTFSFFPSHTITTGEGGMVITNDDELASLARKVANHGRKGDDILDKFHFDFLGINAKMSNLTAAVGAAVAYTADLVIEQRRKNVDFLNEKTKSGWYATSPHCYPILSETRDDDMRRMWAGGVECRKLFSCLPTQERAYGWLGYEKGDFPVAESIGEHGYFVPIHQDLTITELAVIASLL